MPGRPDRGVWAPSPSISSPRQTPGVHPPGLRSWVSGPPDLRPQAPCLARVSALVFQPGLPWAQRLVSATRSRLLVTSCCNDSPGLKRPGDATYLSGTRQGELQTTCFGRKEKNCLLAQREPWPCPARPACSPPAVVGQVALGAGLLGRLQPEGPLRSTGARGRCALWHRHLFGWFQWGPALPLRCFVHS